MGASAARTARLLRFAPGLILGSRGAAGLMLTRRCDMACGYCAVRAPRCGEPREEELDAAAWMRVIRDLRRLGVRHVVLTGGEPTLHEDVCAIARAARRRMLVSLVTNGRFLVGDDPLADRLLPLVDLVSVSCDRFVDTAFRVDEVALEAAGRRLDAAGVPRETIVTLSAPALPHAEVLVATLAGAGWSVRLSLVHGGGAGAPFRGAGAADGADDATGAAGAIGPATAPALAHLARAMEAMRADGLPIADEPGFLADMARFARGEETLRCPAGPRVIELWPDGTVHACQDSPAAASDVATLLRERDPYRALAAGARRPCRCHYSHYYRVAHPLRSGLFAARRLGLALRR